VIVTILTYALWLCVFAALLLPRRRPREKRVPTEIERNSMTRTFGIFE
jgi:hypothetical protein